MEHHKFTIDSEATEAVFAKYGGVEKWQESNARYRPPEQEQKQIDHICMATLMMANEQHTILDSEQEDAYEAIEDGFNLGLDILAYNFMIKQNKLTDGYYHDALEYCADRCATYIEEVESRFKNGTLSSDDLESPNEDQPIDIDGFIHLIDRQIDRLCPVVELQNDFRLGAKAAESIFIAALMLAEHVEKIKFDNTFEQIVSDNNIEFEI